MGWNRHTRRWRVVTPSDPMHPHPLFEVKAVVTLTLRNHMPDGRNEPPREQFGGHTDSTPDSRWIRTGEKNETALAALNARRHKSAETSVVYRIDPRQATNSTTAGVEDRPRYAFHLISEPVSVSASMKPSAMAQRRGLSRNQSTISPTETST